MHEQSQPDYEVWNITMGCCDMQQKKEWCGFSIETLQKKVSAAKKDPYVIIFNSILAKFVPYDSYLEEVRRIKQLLIHIENKDIDLIEKAFP